MTKTIKLGLVGFGKIARDEHLPAIAHTDGAALIAVASRNATAPGITNYPDLPTMLASEPDLDAVILCQPPKARYAAAQLALAAGKHVFLEKPPGATLSEVAALVQQAQKAGVTLYASWHSRHSAPVSALKAWCATHVVTRVTINWKEDVRFWHPGQQWIWEPGGFGVFDPGINALSVLTEVLAEPVRLIEAHLTVPENCATPIAADLDMETASGVPIRAEFDWRQTGPQTWEIIVEAGVERFHFGQDSGEANIASPESASVVATEYHALYSRFIDLVRAGRSDVDVAPLQLVADAFLRGTQTLTTAYLE
jgi:D-galactose 1-dehydrogenase